MREIRLRAWNWGLNKWDYFTPSNIATYIAQFQLHVLSGSEFYLFTGLKDKKRTTEYPDGQDIYEGDEVRWYTWDGYIGESVVEFRDGHFYPIAQGCLEYQRFDEEQGFEVTGNIYEQEATDVNCANGMSSVFTPRGSQ